MKRTRLFTFDDSKSLSFGKAEAGKDQPSHDL